MLLSEMLKNSREAVGYTLSEACERIGISVTYLWELETGKRKRPKIGTLQKIADVYGVSPDVVIRSAEKIPPDVYWKIIHNPRLVEVIRNMEV